MKITLTEDQMEDITREVLLRLVNEVEDFAEETESLLLSLHRMISYFSVPGTYEEGKYDE